MKILLAEDDRATQLRLAAYVQDWGYDCATAGDGAEAWAIFQEEAFDCVISDWKMPKLTGLELVRQIRECGPPTYVYIILLTGQTRKQNLVEGMEAGADDFLTKPFDKDELRVRLRAGQRVIDLERNLAERNRELSTFTSVASHDLREPLRTITAFLGLLQKKYQGQLDQQADEYIQFVMDGAARMRTLITDLLSYARMETQEQAFAPVDLNEILLEKCRSLGKAIEESGAQITHDTLPTVEGDATQLSQLLQNLLANAIKYRADRPPTIHLEALDQDDHWRFNLKDNGIGIAPEHQDSIFQPFRRLHGAGSPYSGSGVGLSICRKVVERHGGRIWAESDGATGTTFSFTMPRRPHSRSTDAR